MQFNLLNHFLRIVRHGTTEQRVYLTFDDGPVPEVTPWVLDVLDSLGAKATFFMVGDNARRHPEIVEEVVRRGHSVGNHTMHHLQGIKTQTARYLADVEECARHVPSRLFRPPHGLLKPSQLARLKSDYQVVFFDIVTHDYSRRLSADDVVGNIKRFARNGAVIVFHDSLKAAPRLRESLPRCLEWLIAEGYELCAIPMA